MTNRETREEQMNSILNDLKESSHKGQCTLSEGKQAIAEYCAAHFDCTKCPRRHVPENERGCAHIFARLFLANAQLATSPTNKYNTRVRQAISDKYVKYSKYRAEVREKLDEVLLRLHDDSILHSEYNSLMDSNHWCEKRLEELNAYVDAFDQAREICLNIAEEEL